MPAPTIEEVLAKTLAELVAWHGEETHVDYCKRLNNAERQLKRVNPAALKAAKQQVRDATTEK